MRSLQIGEDLLDNGVFVVDRLGLGQREGKGLSLKVTWWRQTPNSSACPSDTDSGCAASRGALMSQAVV
ncbi:hypothetical protein [Streptomyces viridochromogenes]|uniref:hypothetical protein n=1 Tax=Streptomyces viridochromogenes TaxID=1938 RepID=UPI00055F2218|nr:hypothetical protein [Streptomyces viridochromogenes]